MFNDSKSPGNALNYTTVPNGLVEIALGDIISSAHVGRVETRVRCGIKSLQERHNRMEVWTNRQGHSLVHIK